MTTPKCLDVQSWRLPKVEEVRAFVEERNTPLKKTRRKKPSVLAVREHLKPVDIYCYLKARFGKPNGFQTFLRKDDSDNWIHWDFLLRVEDRDVNISGMSRETHIMVSEQMTDENWRDLIKAIKADYGRVGKEKSAVFKALQRWVTFPNRFVEVANICANLHAEILEHIEGFSPYKTLSFKTGQQRREAAKHLTQLTERSHKLYQPCLELSLLTPVLAETFINMLILILCKHDVRTNQRQFDAFIRSHIDVKIFDLSLKCERFARSIDPNSETYKKFKQMMDKRNDVIHGNANPIAEQLEMVYFEGKRPLFKDGGDNIGRTLEALERQYQPKLVIQQYLDTYTFLLDIAAHLEPGFVHDFWAVMEDNYPGYDLDRLITGRLFPEHVVVGGFQGVKYDDELPVTWN